MPSLRDTFPLRLLIGGEDCTHLVDQGFTFSNVDPGGFEAASFPIPKDMPQTIVGQPVRLDSGTQVGWEGRISEIQRSLGNRTLVQCEGYSARLKDQAGAMIFVDRDLTQWQGPSIDRQINLVNIGYAPASPQVVADPASGNPAVDLAVTAPWASGGLPSIEGWYDSRGIPIGSLYYQAEFDTNAAGNLSGFVFLSVDDVLVAGFDDQTFSSNTTNTLSAGGGGSRVYAALLAEDFSAVASGTAAYNVYFLQLALYGKHGLTGVGSAPVGFYPSQIAGWVAGQISGLQIGTIQETDATGYVAPHIVYYDPVTLDTMLNDMGQLAGWHWGVWESPTYLLGNTTPRLDFLPRPAAGTWDAWAWRAECDDLDLRFDLSNLYDECVVQYTTVDGLDRSVTETLDNPQLDASGIGRGAGGPGRTMVLSGGTMTQAAAETLATIALELSQEQASVAGQITITTAIHSANGGPMPAWMLRAGENRIRVPDIPSADYAGAYNDLPISRVECSVGEDGLSTSVEIGVVQNLIETLQSRLTAAAQLAGQGG